MKTSGNTKTLTKDVSVTETVSKHKTNLSLDSSTENIDNFFKVV